MRRLQRHRHLDAQGGHMIARFGLEDPPLRPVRIDPPRRAADLRWSVDDYLDAARPTGEMAVTVGDEQAET